MQLRLAIKTGNTLKEREYHWRSAEAFDRLGEFKDAEEQLKALQDNFMPFGRHSGTSINTGASQLQ